MVSVSTINALVGRAAEEWPDAEALVDGDVRLTFAQLHDAVVGSARAAIAAGIEPGDRAAIWAPNMAEWVIAALGVHGAGGAIVPLNTRYKGHEAGYILGKSGAKVLFTVQGFLGFDYPAMLDGVDLPDLARTVVLRGPSWDAYLAAGDPVDHAEAVARSAAVGPDDVSDLIFTSGTTGRPKGVMSTHGQTVRTFEDWSGILGLRAGDRYLVVNPFFHTFGYKAGFVSAIMRGATTIPLPVFEVPAVLELVSREKVSMLPGPPTLFQTILEHPDRGSYDLSSLRLCATGAAVIPVELVKRMRAELFETVITAYGLTESTGVATMCRADDDAEIIATTSGRAIHDVEVRIVDDDNLEVTRGEPGEIVVRGYNVMKGYFEEPEQTAEAVDAEGWLHTGDVGTMDAEGNIKITDRKKDMFIVGGFNAYPAEIEASLLRHPAVAMVAVVGIPDERMGEVGMAFVVPKPGATVDADELIAWSREEMANYKAPRRVAVVDALPLNASGKVLKHELRARALEEQNT
jgi:acyl-CoA synthetase (AMP-forming)/AMP-acid ligase II